MNFIRFSTWKNKLAPFLGLVYAFFYKKSNLGIEKELQIILFLLLGIVLIAIWASLVNNYYDVEFDKIAGKKNQMVKLKPFFRKFCLVLSIFSCLIYSYFLLFNKYAIIFFGLGCICFFLYSSSSIRLKEKPFWDLITDGLASQLFPALYIFAFLFNNNFNENYIFIFSGSLWLFIAMGIRALIIHQYQDEEKDRDANLNTYVIGIKAKTRNKFELCLLFCEILLFSIFAISLSWKAFCLSIVLYSLFIIICKKWFSKTRFIKFHLSNTLNDRIILYDAYTIFTFCIIGLLCIQNVQNILIISAHLLFFHHSVILKFGNYLINKHKFSL